MGSGETKRGELLIDLISTKNKNGFYKYNKKEYPEALVELTGILLLLCKNATTLFQQLSIHCWKHSWGKVACIIKTISTLLFSLAAHFSSNFPFHSSPAVIFPLVEECVRGSTIVRCCIFSAVGYFPSVGCIFVPRSSVSFFFISRSTEPANSNNNNSTSLAELGLTSDALEL